MCKSCRLVINFIACFILLVIAPLQGTGPANREGPTAKCKLLHGTIKQYRLAERKSCRLSTSETEMQLCSGSETSNDCSLSCSSCERGLMSAGDETRLQRSGRVSTDVIRLTARCNNQPRHDEGVEGRRSKLDEATSR